VHIHGFKCAGTTFSASLAHNFNDRFRCIEPSTKHVVIELHDVEKTVHELDLYAISSHSLNVPICIPSEYFFVHLIREPSERLISAWRFEVETQRTYIGEFSDYINDRKGEINLQSSYLFSRNKIEKNLSNSKFKHRSNLFLGIVERYDESMTVLEFLLKQNGIDLDLSYPDALNANEQSRAIKVNELAIPNDFIDLDHELYKIANERLNYYISIVPNFGMYLTQFRKRCKEFQKTRHEFAEKITNERWHILDVEEAVIQN
jgi:hypothetical protein